MSSTNTSNSAPQQPLRRISLEQRRSSIEQQQTSDKQRRENLEKLGSFEMQQSCTMRRRTSGDSFAKYSYHDLIVAMEIVRGFVESQDHLALVEHCDSSDDEEDIDMSNCLVAAEGSSECESVSSLGEEEDEEFVCFASTLMGEATALSPVDSSVASCITTPRVTSPRVSFVSHAQVREYSLTVQSSDENACHLCLSWEHATPDQRVPIRDSPSKTVRRLSLHQKEKRLAKVTGLTLDKINEIEEDSHLQQFEGTMGRCKRLSFKATAA